MSTLWHDSVRSRLAIGVALASCLTGIVLLVYLDPFSAEESADELRTQGHLITDGNPVDPVGGILNSILHDEYLPRRIHGAAVDRLDMPGEPSLPLQEAIAQSGLGDISLPDVSVVGEPVRVVLNETVADRSGKGRVGLMILYESGIKLIISPGTLDLQERMDSFEGALPFRDGRPSPYEMHTVAGRPTLVAAAGTQYQGRAEIETEANLIWNMGDAHYWLKAPLANDGSAPATGRADQETCAPSMPDSVDDLVRVAESLTPAR